MSKALSIIERAMTKTFDCGLSIEVLNTDLTKKTMTVLVDSNDDWGDRKSLHLALDFINTKLIQVAKNDPSAIGYKSAGFKMSRDCEGAVEFKKFLDWEPHYISTKINQG